MVRRGPTARLTRSIVLTQKEKDLDPNFLVTVFNDTFALPPSYD